MKKTITKRHWVHLVMKVSVPFILVLLIGQLTFARAGYSQDMLNRKVNVEIAKADLKTALNEISKSANVRFSYVSSTVRNHRVSISSKNESLETVLEKLLAPLRISYRVSNDFIILDKQTEVREQSGANSEVQLTEPDPDKTTASPAERTITGKVSAENGELLPGVSIVVKGTQNGTLTDAKGKFEIAIQQENATLIFSFVGYLSQEIPIGNQSDFTIILKDDLKSLEEVVVVGYGTVRKSDLTGSVARLKMEGTSELPVTSVEQMLQGRVSGVQITQNTGAPGGGMSFLVRGANSVSGSNQPLIVIDGYPIETGSTAPNIGNSDSFSDTPGNNALANLNPNDIESVEILKDASATAIYGSRGANGVVLVTTKRGQAGKERIEYSFRTDFSRIPKKLDVLDAPEYLAYMNEARTNSGQPPLYDQTQLDQLGKETYNWQDLIYRTAKTQNHQLSVSGGDDRLKYNIAGNFLSQEGIIINSQFNRGSIRANLDRQVSKKLKIGMNFSASMSKNNSVPQSTGNGNISGSVVLGALLSRPIDQPYTNDEEIDLAMVGNPATLISLYKDETKEKNVLVNIFADYELMKGLKFRINAGVNDGSSKRQTYSPRGTYSGNTYNGQAYQGESSRFNYLAEYTLNYNRVFNKVHSVNAVAGFTWQEWKTEGIGITVRQFPNDNLTYYNLQSGNTIGRPSSSTQQWALSSWLGRINYSFDNRYLVTFTGRTDGSTRLAPGQKWSFFPSLAVGWNLHNEKFMKDLSAISELKIRASYGLSGNQSIGVGSTMAKLNTVSSVAGQSVVVGYTQGSMSNSNLGWEATSQYNIGADVAFFRGRVRGGFEYYKKNSTDLLLNLQISPSTGFTTYATNVGEIENKGYEFDLSVKILTGKVQWDASGNISFNRNKVLNLGELPLMTGPVFGVNNLNQPLHVAMPGYPIGSFYGYQINGIYQNQVEIDGGPSDPARPTPGDFRYADISGPNGVPDGAITASDRTILGNPYPDYIFGITNTLSWKNLSLSFLFQGSIGQDIINLNRLTQDAMNGTSSANIFQSAWDNRWTGEGTSNTYPKPTMLGYPFQGRFSDFIVEDGSYVRLKNLTIGYNIPSGKIKFIRSFRIFASGTNLFTMTKYTGYDPEINSRGQNAMTPGVDYGSIPQMKVYSLGFNVGF